MSYSAKTLRLIEGYKFVSVIVLNTIVIVLVLNAFAWISVRRSSPQYKPEYFLGRQEVYPGYTPDEIALLMKETWDKPFQYEPWIGFKEKPRHGRFVNISEEGFRYSHKKGGLNLNDEAIKIYVFGGSTTFGYGVEDASTIPAHLQKRLSSVYPDKNIEVFNFGRAYYYSTQELALLLQLLRQAHSPDIVIFIDGWNESPEAPYFTDDLAFLFDAYNYSPNKLNSIVVEQIPLVSYLQQKLMQGNSTNQTFRKTKRHRDPVEIRNEYLRNRDIINLLATKYRFSAYCFIHPVPGYRNRYWKHKFWKRRSSDSLNSMKEKMQLLEDTVNHVNVFSMTALLQNYSKQPFVDKIHFTPEVCDLIAEFITQKIRIE